MTTTLAEFSNGAVEIVAGDCFPELLIIKTAQVVKRVRNHRAMANGMGMMRMERIPSTPTGRSPFIPPQFDPFRPGGPLGSILAPPFRRYSPC